MKSINADISKRLKEFREAKNLSQKKIAEILDITEKQYSNIECGKRFMTAETLEKLEVLIKSEEKTKIEEQRKILDKMLEKYLKDM